MLVFLTKLSLNGISDQISGLISSFLSNDGYKWFWMGSFHKSFHEFSLVHFNAGKT